MQGIVNMDISEQKMRITINNYFHKMCTVDTSIRQAFELGFRLGVEKGYSAGKNAGLKSAAEICAKTDWSEQQN